MKQSVNWMQFKIANECERKESLLKIKSESNVSQFFTRIPFCLFMNKDHK